MVFEDLREINLTGLLPRELKDSLVCYTSAKCEDNGPDLVTCHRNGCLYEIKNRRIQRSLNLGETAVSVGCYFLLETRNIVSFYLVHTEGDRMMIIRRYEKSLKIVQDYDSVKDIQVYDFESLGYPQIKITFLNEGSILCKFPVEHDEETDSLDNSSFVGDSLADELQLINTCIDEQTEEYNQLKKICSLNNAPTDSKKILVPSVTFSSPLNEAVEHKLTVTNKWLRVFGTVLILGMKICNTGNEIIHDIEVTINHKKIKDYAYSFFQSLNDFSNYLFSPEGITRTIKPGEEMHAAVTFQVPAFFAESEFTVPCYITCSNFSELLLRETFEVCIQDVASKTIVGLEERFTMEDLIALKAAKSETRIKIRVEDSGESSLEPLLVENLGFKRIKHVKDGLFYCTSTFLSEVFVAVRHTSVNPSVWKLIIFQSNPSQIFFIVNGLYDLLPENTSILRDE